MGYVDPCARSSSALPERFFTFDTLTGEIIARQGLSPARRKKAIQMIDDLRLNELHHLQKRRNWIWLVSEALSTDSGDTNRNVSLLSVILSRSTELSSLARAWVNEQSHVPVT